MIPILLDTCAVIWLAEGASLARGAVDALDRAHGRSEVVRIPAISAWEIGLLIARGRIRSQISPHAWFRRAIAVPGIELIGHSPDTLIASSFLPGRPPADPADRIIAATAREHGYALMTRDRVLLAYGEEGHIQVIEC